MEQPEQSSESDDPSTKKFSEAKCESCLENYELESMFKCASCTDKLETANALPFLCDSCIVAHLRKGHDISDHSSLKPAVCQMHKNLCSMYCTNCEGLMCTNCLSKHVNHNIMPIKDKASQVRSNVFEMLSDLDSYEKIVRGTKERLHEGNESRANRFEKFFLDFSSEIDSIKQKISDHVRLEHEKTLEVERESAENVEALLNCQNELRELLSSSEGNLVVHIKEKENQLTEVKNKEAELKFLEIQNMDYSMSQETTELLAKFQEDLMKSIKTSVVVKKWEN